MPKRIQRSRTKGWKMPEGAIYVGRPTKFGNPFYTGDIGHSFAWKLPTVEQCVEWYRKCITEPSRNWMLKFKPEEIQELRGKDLVCWCDLDKPCHADVLLDLANEYSGDKNEQ